VNKTSNFPDLMNSEILEVATWKKVVSELKNLLSKDVFDTWFKELMPLAETNDKLILEAANEFAAYWIQDNYLGLIRQVIEKITGRSILVSVKVAAEEKSTVPRNRLGAGELPPVDLYDQRLSQSETPQPVIRGNHISKPLARLTNVNPKNTFSTFVVGPGNQFAHAACMAVANAPATSYNPLFLYGETGLGKTHLMHAIAQQVHEANPHLRVAYISSEKFTNEFIHAIQERTFTRFRNRYRKVDVLLIDDIHFLAQKERIQEEFFHTFNDLFESQKQIVLSSDRPANEIAKLENRLVSRFQWGLVVDIQPPDLETRMAILSKKADAMKVHLQLDVLEFLAKRVTRNIRRMEGALTRVASHAELCKKPVDIPMAADLLKDIIQDEARLTITVEKIQKKVSDYHHLHLADMVSRRRPNNIAFPRQIAMYLSRLLTNLSLKEIGEAFGGRDHGTVIYACTTVGNRMEVEESVKRTVDYLQAQLTQSAD
jgi:chromosomal replication initiator protein